MLISSGLEGKRFEPFSVCWRQSYTPKRFYLTSGRTLNAAQPQNVKKIVTLQLLRGENLGGMHLKTFLFC